MLKKCIIILMLSCLIACASSPPVTPDPDTSSDETIYLEQHDVGIENSGLYIPEEMIDGGLFLLCVTSIALTLISGGAGGAACGGP